MAFRLLLLAAMGLGAMYMMHLLAQDYNKIRRPVQVASKVLRSIFLTKRDLSDFTEKDKQAKEMLLKWDKVINNDPLSCALSLVCQLSADKELTTNNNYANEMFEFISFSVKTSAPSLIIKSYNYGEKTKDYKKCYKMYPLCPYSGKIMIKLLELQSLLFQ